MGDSVFDEIGDYILNRQNTAAKYIAMRPILDLRKKTVRRPGAWVARRWWEQEGIHLASLRAQVAAEEDKE